jgi:NAD(P)-dependent dehydrogenase (short-subunit alcohol dehydrogenase family)
MRLLHRAGGLAVSVVRVPEAERAQPAGVENDPDSGTLYPQSDDLRDRRETMEGLRRFDDSKRLERTRMAGGSRVWLISGASRGLGRAFAEAALEVGDTVVAAARRPETLAELVEEYGSRVAPVTLDVTDRAQVLSVVEGTLETQGRIDVLVNNAGYGLAGGVEEVTEEQARHQMEVNFFGALWCTQAVLAPMRRQRRGHIFQISSMGGVAAFLNTGVYHASKWALEGLSESLAQEVAPFGIRVTIIEPGPFRTDWNGDSLTRATPMEVYDAVLGARREAHSGKFARTQPGDPRGAAQALLRVLASDDPPLRLLLGTQAADLAPQIYHRRLEEWARWDETAREADFPTS